MGRRCPRGVVRAQGLAIGVADERGAIVDLRRPGAGLLEILRLGEIGAPSAKGGARWFAIEAQRIGGAVTAAVALRKRCGEGDARGWGAGEFDADLYGSRQDARVDFKIGAAPAAFEGSGEGDVRIADYRNTRGRAGWRGNGESGWSHSYRPRVFWERSPREE